MLVHAAAYDDGGGGGVASTTLIDAFRCARSAGRAWTGCTGAATTVGRRAGRISGSSISVATAVQQRRRSSGTSSSPPPHSSAVIVLRRDDGLLEVRARHVAGIGRRVAHPTR